MLAMTRKFKRTTIFITFYLKPDNYEKSRIFCGFFLKILMLTFQTRHEEFLLFRKPFYKNLLRFRLNICRNNGFQGLSRRYTRIFLIRGYKIPTGRCRQTAKNVGRNCRRYRADAVPLSFRRAFPTENHP